MKAFAELLRLQQHDFHSFKIIEELEDEVFRAVRFSTPSLLAWAMNVNKVNRTVLNSLKEGWLKKKRGRTVWSKNRISGREVMQLWPEEIEFIV